LRQHTTEIHNFAQQQGEAASDPNYRPQLTPQQELAFIKGTAPGWWQNWLKSLRESITSILILSACLAWAIYRQRTGRLLAGSVSRSVKPQGRETTLAIWETLGGLPILCIPIKSNSYPAVFSRDGRLVAFVDSDELQLWDLATRREVWRKSDPLRAVASLAFAPDGRTLAVGYNDTTILIWNLPQPEKQTSISESERDSVWADLASPDPTKGHAAMWRLIDDPKTAIPLVRERLLPAPAAAEAVRMLVKDLGHADFKEREAAAKRLREMGRAAQPELRAALKAESRPEAKRRLESMAAVYESDEERRRVSRAVAALERIGTADARRVLERVNGP